MTEANYVDISWNTGATTDNRFTERVQYDVRGNIKHLERYGLNGSCSWGLIDNLNYFHSDDFSYNPTNRLLRVVDNSDLTKGFKTVQNGSNYTYDDNGNMTSDLNKNITGINYNYLNLPTTITFTNNRSITFMYDAGGTKLRKTVTQNSVVQYTQDYVGGIEYRNGVLEAVYHAEGRISLIKSPTETTASFKYEYALKDHLGNTRLMFCDRNADGKITTSSASGESEVTQENHYYPFGLNMEGATNQWYNDAVADNKYQYNGKEWNDDFGLGMNDYGARMYDPAIGKWNAIDPMAHKFHAFSPYNYVANNPISNIDPDGMCFESTNRPLPASTRDANGNTTFRGAAGTLDGGMGAADHKKNIYIMLHGGVDNLPEINGHLTKKKQGDWTVIQTGNLTQALEELKELGISKGSVENMVLETHGMLYSTSKGGKVWDGFTLRDGTVFPTDEPGKSGEKSMIELISYMQSGGDFVLAACGSGQGENGTNLLTTINSWTKNCINITANSSDGCALLRFTAISTNKKPPVYSGYLIGTNYQYTDTRDNKKYQANWKRLKSDGTIEYIKELNIRLTGTLIQLSR
jgi:RHS repeat-associated protein